LPTPLSDAETHCKALKRGPTRPDSRVLNQSTRGRSARSRSSSPTSVGNSLPMHANGISDLVASKLISGVPLTIGHRKARTRGPKSARSWTLQLFGWLNSHFCADSRGQPGKRHLQRLFVVHQVDRRGTPALRSAASCSARHRNIRVCGNISIRS